MSILYIIDQVLGKWSYGWNTAQGRGDYDIRRSTPFVFHFGNEGEWGVPIEPPYTVELSAEKKPVVVELPRRYRRLAVDMS
jgi:hypothetical protein